jgi:hypothetical protein
VSHLTASIPSLNRRADKRRRCPSAATATVALLPDCRRLTASVKDISPRGAGLYLAEAGLERGTRVLVQLLGPCPGTTLTTLAEVAHSGPDGDRQLVGCKFLSSVRPSHLSETYGLGG